ncbi:MAG: DUF3298 and DUF4163 domain-containing protein [Candidatus Colwellbacteria bacterium]|nr:DUF3298 and DUF4163 domain-containing protein [Candidatus Colwellbacteria bacterium]
MDRKRLEMPAFAVLGIVILAVWGWQALNPQTPESGEITLRTPEIKEVKIEEDTPQYRIEVSYPEFHNLGDPVRETAANNLLKSKVQQSVDSLKSASEEAVEISPEIKSELQLDYEVVHINSSVASIKMRESTYVEGAAHPLGIFWPFNYNFKDNKEIALADIFKPGSNYLEVLSGVTKKDLKNQLKEYYTEGVLEFGTAPVSENFSTLFLAKDKLVIIFNVYSVAAYAAGSQTVEVPYDALSEIINPEGIIKLIRE